MTRDRNSPVAPLATPGPARAKRAQGNAAGRGGDFGEAAARGEGIPVVLPTRAEDSLGLAG